jgi:hypothetical protein
MKLYSEFIKEYKEYKESEIELICKEFIIEDYTINLDGSIDVLNNVNLFGRKLKRLPLNFGIVSGYFDCSDNKLTTLEGSPKSVGGYFNCPENELITLAGGPIEVGGNFYCERNKLVTLEGGPIKVNGNVYDCENNKLRSLKGFPEIFWGEFYYALNPIEEIIKLSTFDDPKNRPPNQQGFQEDVQLHEKVNKFINLINEYDVIRGNRFIIGDRLEEVLYILGLNIPDNIKFDNYEMK